jgi:hypothetical protein
MFGRHRRRRSASPGSAVRDATQLTWAAAQALTEATSIVAAASEKEARAVRAGIASQIVLRHRRA